MGAHVVDHLLVDPLRRAAQRQLAQRRQIAGLEIVAHRPLRLLGQVDLAFLQALGEILGREIDDLDLIGAVDDRIRHRLADPHAGDLGDDVVEALDMLDIQRGIDVDAGVQQLLDIEIALGMAAARRIGMGELVDQSELGPARQDGVDIHLAEMMALVFDEPARDHLQPVEQGLGLLAAVGLGHADDDVDPLAALGLGRGQHLVGLADARRCPQEDLQPAAGFLGRLLQQGLRRGPVVAVGSLFVHRHMVSQR